MHTWITAHTGCDGTPDNSLESILHAQRTQADVIEIDVRLDPTGRFYLSHHPAAEPDVFLETVFDLMRNSRQGLN